MRILLQLHGGLQCVTKSLSRELELQLPDGASIEAAIKVLVDEHVIKHQRHNLLQNPEDFSSYLLKHGILLLVNDADWELFGSTPKERAEHQLADGDIMTLITTLHGG